MLYFLAFQDLWTHTQLIFLTIYFNKDNDSRISSTSKPSLLSNTLSIYKNINMKISYIYTVHMNMKL